MIGDRINNSALPRIIAGAAAVICAHCSTENRPTPLSNSEETSNDVDTSRPVNTHSDETSRDVSGSSSVSTATEPTGSTPTSDSSENPAPAPNTDAPLSERYPGDVGLADDPDVLFFDDFETGWGRWDAPNEDSTYLHLENDPSQAYSGQRYLRSTVTSAHLAETEYISSQTRIELPARTPTFFARFYAQFVGTAPTPHHWVRITAGTPEFNGSGRANTVPPGDEGFWFDFDVDTNDVFNFYVYWFEMRSGRCNDGSTEPGCPGDQGTTYHYGNVFRPPGQMPFARDTWVCIEMRAQANTVGDSDGELQFWINDEPVGEYKPGFPEGTWLRDSFHTNGCDFSACTEPQPFEGFEFRAAEDVLFKTFQLDAYYERGSSADKRATLEERGITVDDAQTILYDDVVVATRRIGCRR